ncbi:glycosyltransferase [Amedibacillus sp. YH-ame6]
MNDIEKRFPKYSVLMAVYIKDDPKWFALAIESMMMQTIPPNDFVIIEDGPITESLKSVIVDYQSKHPNLFQIISLEKNVGLGMALNIGIEKCKYEHIARMDSDDYSACDRCEKQLEEMMKSNIDIIGCDVNEFIDMPNNVIATRVFPEKHNDIVAFSRRRTPFAHPAVIMKKSQIIQVGNYQNAYLHEDYDLFVRLLAYGCKGYTMKECLVSMRVNENFYERRGGYKYLRTLLAFNKKLYKMRWMHRRDFLARSIANTISCLAPNIIRDYIYRRFLRK